MKEIFLRLKKSKAYTTYFKIHFINGLQYRAAAFGGIMTQFAWGFMRILLFFAFYEAAPEKSPMDLSQLSTYIWLQQALLAMFNTWLFDNDIFDSITTGNIAYELCRPVKIYELWFARGLAGRLSKVVLRCFPILIVAAFLPAPYGISLSGSAGSFFLFLFSAVLGALLMTAITMLIYLSAFYTVSPMGIRIFYGSLTEIFAGLLIPIPFMPSWMQAVVNATPLAYTQSTPFLIYNGFLQGQDAFFNIGIQLLWIVIIVAIGKLISQNATKKVVIQGG